MTRERIRQIEAKALRKLRHPSRSHRLRAFLENGTRDPGTSERTGPALCRCARHECKRGARRPLQSSDLSSEVLPARFARGSAAAAATTAGTPATAAAATAGTSTATAAAEAAAASAAAAEAALGFGTGFVDVQARPSRV